MAVWPVGIMLNPHRNCFDTTKTAQIGLGVTQNHDLRGLRSEHDPSAMIKLSRPIACVVGSLRLGLGLIRPPCFLLVGGDASFSDGSHALCATILARLVLHVCDGAHLLPQRGGIKSLSCSSSVLTRVQKFGFNVHGGNLTVPTLACYANNDWEVQLVIWQQATFTGVSLLFAGKNSSLLDSPVQQRNLNWTQSQIDRC